MEMIFNLVIRNQAFIRESINGAGMIFCAFLALMIGVFMFNAWWNSTEYDDWAHMQGMPVACALLWVFTFESYRMGAVWLIYRMGGHSIPDIGVFAMADFPATFGYLIAGVGINAFLLRCVYLFTPPLWRRVVWRVALATMSGFLTISTLTTSS